MPPKSSARKGVKKGMPKTEPSTGTHTPKIKAEVSSPTPAFFANDENESEYNFDMTPVPGPISNLLPCIGDYFTLCHAPTADPTGYPIFVSRNGRWDWYYLSSNNKTTESPATPANDTTNLNTKNTKKSSPLSVKMEDIPEANPRIQRPSNPVSSTFSDNLGHLIFTRGVRDSDDDISSVPSLVENIAEQARTAKHVRFFMNTSHNKHFIPIEVPSLLGNENWEYWLAAMLLLFRQHSVWPTVTAELQPLSPSHNLYLWYQRMRDCAIELIYANVSEEVRKTPCFISTVRDDDPNVLMRHLYAHYASSDSDHSYDESELD